MINQLLLIWSKLFATSFHPNIDSFLKEKHDCKVLDNSVVFSLFLKQLSDNFYPFFCRFLPFFHLLHLSQNKNFSGNYVLTYLYNQPKLAQFVIQGLVTLFARITNLGWFDSKDDEFVFRNVISDVTKFLQGSADHCMIGVQLLSQLTCEMNQVSIENWNLNFKN